MDSTGKIWAGFDCSKARALELLPIVAAHPVVYGVKSHIVVEGEIYRQDGEISLVAEYARYAKLKKWLDFKYDDTEETVRQRLEVHLPHGVFTYATCMANSGASSLQAAVKAAGDSITIIGVTELTSKPEDEVLDLSGRTRPESVLHLAHKLHHNDVATLVCSGNELEALAADRIGKQFQKFVPGIKFGGTANKGQVNVVTPALAFERGATRIVVASALVNATEPLRVLDAIAEEIERI